jgi:hypothetical protein
MEPPGPQAGAVTENTTEASGLATSKTQLDVKAIARRAGVAFTRDSMTNTFRGPTYTTPRFFFGPGAIVVVGCVDVMAAMTKVFASARWLMLPKALDKGPPGSLIAKDLHGS